MLQQSMNYSSIVLAKSLIEKGTSYNGSEMSVNLFELYFITGTGLLKYDAPSYLAKINPKNLEGFYCQIQKS